MATTEYETLSGPWVGYTKAAEHTSLSKSKLRQLVADKRIPAKRVDGRVLIPLSALVALIENSPNAADSGTDEGR